MMTIEEFTASLRPLPTGFWIEAVSGSIPFFIAKWHSRDRFRAHASRFLDANFAAALRRQFEKYG